jgi:arylsulfatase
VHEGGSCTPLIVYWPAGISAQGEIRHTHGHITDVVPTILDLAGIPYDNLNEVPFPGKTLRPLFERDTSWEHPVWYYHEGNRGIRIGDWKLVAEKGAPWELYNLIEDRTETNNLAETYPGQVLKMEKQWYTMLGDMRKVAPLIIDEKEDVKVTTENLE